MSRNGTQAITTVEVANNVAMDSGKGLKTLAVISDVACLISINENNNYIAVIANVETKFGGPIFRFYAKAVTGTGNVRYFGYMEDIYKTDVLSGKVDELTLDITDRAEKSKMF